MAAVVPVGHDGVPFNPRWRTVAPQMSKLAVYLYVRLSPRLRLYVPAATWASTRMQQDTSKASGGRAH